MRLAVAFLAVLLFTTNLLASGAVGIYGIVTKVVFEPNEQAPERIQVWGAFAFFDGERQSTTAAKRGYLYFTVPPRAAGAPLEVVRREWADLKSLAGTGQAVAFGQWFYLGPFDGLQPNAPANGSRIFSDNGFPVADVRVRTETEPLESPSRYATNAGIVKLSAEGNHAEIVKQLRESLNLH